MKYYRLQRGAKDVNPVFKNWEETTQKLTGTLKAVYLNDAKTVPKKDWTGDVTIPANMAIVFEEDVTVQVNYELGSLFRTLANSLLSVKLGDMVQLYLYNKTYTKQDWTKGTTKTVSVTNPAKQVERKRKDWTAFTANEMYSWAVEYKDIPEVEIIKNKKGEFVSSDDSEANEFFIDKLTETFVTPNKKAEGSSDEINVEDIPFN